MTTLAKLFDEILAPQESGGEELTIMGMSAQLGLPAAEVQMDYAEAKEQLSQERKRRAKAKIEQQKAEGLATTLEDIQESLPVWANPVGHTKLGAATQRAMLAGGAQFVTGTQSLLQRLGMPGGVTVESTADKTNRESARFSAATESANVEAGLSGGEYGERWLMQQVQGISRSLSEVVFYAPLTGGLGGGLKAGGRQLLKKGTKWASAPLIASFTAKAANSALTEARDAGLSEGAANRYALVIGGVEGLFTTFFQVKGMPGLEGLPQAFLGTAERATIKKVMVNLSHEVREELAIGLATSLTQKLSGVDPEALTLNSLRRMTIDTLAQTVGAMGAVQSPAIAQIATQQFTKQEPLPPDGAAELVEQKPDAIDINSVLTPEAALAFAEQNPQAAYERSQGTSRDDWTGRTGLATRKKAEKLLGEAFEQVSPRTQAEQAPTQEPQDAAEPPEQANTCEQGDNSTRGPSESRTERQ